MCILIGEKYNNAVIDCQWSLQQLLWVTLEFNFCKTNFSLGSLRWDLFIVRAGVTKTVEIQQCAL